MKHQALIGLIIAVFMAITPVISHASITCDPDTTETRHELLIQENAITFPILGLPGGEGSADQVIIFYQTETSNPRVDVDTGDPLFPDGMHEETITFTYDSNYNNIEFIQLDRDAEVNLSASKDNGRLVINWCRPDDANSIPTHVLYKNGDAIVGAFTTSAVMEGGQLVSVANDHSGGNS